MNNRNEANQALKEMEESTKKGNSASGRLNKIGDKSLAEKVKKVSNDMDECVKEIKRKLNKDNN